jgi:hypothetical protein
MMRGEGRGKEEGMSMNYPSPSINILQVHPSIVNLPKPLYLDQYQTSFSLPPRRQVCVV